MIGSCKMFSGFCPARLPIHALSAVSGAQFLTGGVFECDIAHRQSVAVFCVLFKIRCNQKHPFNGALPGPYVPVRVTRGALVTHRYTYAPLAAEPRSTA